MSVSSSWLCLFSYGYAYVHCLVYCLMFVHVMFANGYTYNIIYGYAYMSMVICLFSYCIIYGLRLAGCVINTFLLQNKQTSNLATDMY